MNIIQAYLKKYNKCIIAISGLCGSGKSNIAKQLALDLERNKVPFKLINLEEYRYNEKEIKATISEGNVVNDTENLGMYDWGKFNNDIEQFMGNGVIIYGEMLPESKLKIQPDIHLHVKQVKQNLLANRKKYVEKHNQTFDEEKELQIMNKIIYPRYMKYLEEESKKINKFLNANKKNEEELINEAFGYIMNFVQEKL